MKFYKLNSNKLIDYKISKYRIKWDNPSISQIQYIVKQFFKKHWFGHVCCEEMRIPGSRLRLDLFNATLSIAVEIQGHQHDNYNSFFHKNRLDYARSIQRDLLKEDWCNKNNIKLVKIYENEIDELSEKFLIKNKIMV